jgi:hypothetical protein
MMLDESECLLVLEPPTRYKMEVARREQVRTMANALPTFRLGHSRREKLSTCPLLPSICRAATTREGDG